MLDHKVGLDPVTQFNGFPVESSFQVSKHTTSFEWGGGPTLTKFKPSPHWAKFGLCLIAYDMWFGFYFIFIFIGARFKYALLGPKNRSGLPDMLT